MPVDAVTVAAPPTVASGDAASIVIERLRLTSVPETDGSAGAELGDVLLPPHAGIVAPSVSSETACHVRTQNSRRVDAEDSRLSVRLMRMPLCNDDARRKIPFFFHADAGRPDRGTVRVPQRGHG